METTQVEQPSAVQPAADSAPTEAQLAERLQKKLFGEEPPAQQAPQEPAQEAPEVTTEQPAEPQEAQDDSEEVEFNGQRYVVPKELKSALMANSDYTKKTQEISAVRSALQAEREAIAIQNQLSQQTAAETQQLALIDAQLRQMQALDWSNMDTDTLIRTKHNRDQLNEMRMAVSHAIQEKAEQAKGAIQQAVVKAREDGVKWLLQAIPNFSGETAKHLVEYATTDGYSKEEIEAVMDPRMIRTLWKAQQWDAMQSKSKQIAEKKIASAGPVLKPGSQASSDPRAQKAQEFRKAIRASKSDTDKAKHIQNWLADKLGR